MRDAWKLKKELNTVYDLSSDGCCDVLCVCVYVKSTYITLQRLRVLDAGGCIYHSPQAVTLLLF